MQTTQDDMEMRIGSERAARIEMPEPRTLIAAAAIAGGTIAAGLVLYYYLRKRRERMGC